MRHAVIAVIVGVGVVLAGCGPSAEEVQKKARMQRVQICKMSIDSELEFLRLSHAQLDRLMRSYPDTKSIETWGKEQIENLHKQTELKIQKVRLDAGEDKALEECDKPKK